MKFRNIFATLLLMVGVVSISLAQTAVEAGETLNKAIQLQKQKNYLEAAKIFEKAYKMAEEAGPDAAKIQTTAKEQITKSYYKDAVATYKAKKYLEAIEKFNVTEKMANKYGDAKLAKKSKAIVPQLYVVLGGSMKKAKKYDEALGYYDKALALKKNYSKAFLGKMLVYKDLDKPEEFMAAYNTIKANPKVTKTSKKAHKLAGQYFLMKAKKSFDAKKNAEALKYAEKYKELGKSDAQGNYLLALIYNANKKYQDVVKVLADVEKATDKDLKANMYFELGNAYAGMKNNAKACESFKKAVNGPNGKAAEYQMKQVLKCK